MRELFDVARSLLSRRSSVAVVPVGVPVTACGHCTSGNDCNSLKCVPGHFLQADMLLLNGKLMPWYFLQKSS